jgi:AraC-like DNA-binding protein
MADDKTKRARRDAARNNIHEDYEVRHWTKELGVTKAELEGLVKEYGTSAKKVREAIRMGHKAPI